MSGSTQSTGDTGPDAEGEERDIPIFEGQVVFQGDYETFDTNDNE